MWHPLLLLYWVNFFHCNCMYDQLLLINFDEIVFPHLHFFHHFFIIDTYHWLCIIFFLQRNECIKLTFGLNVDMRKVLISYKIITVWCIQIIWFTTVDFWVISNIYPLLILVWNLPTLFYSWRYKHHDFLFYFCKIVSQYNRN